MRIPEHYLSILGIKAENLFNCLLALFPPNLNFLIKFVNV